MQQNCLALQVKTYQIMLRWKHVQNTMQSTHTWSTVLHAISIGDLNINWRNAELLPSFWQVADAQEVRWACCLAAFASHTILHTWWRRHLLGSVDSGGDHLQHISRTGANTKSAANASVVDFHCMGPSSHLHAFRIQKRDEHSIQVLYICYYMWCFSMSFGTTFGSKGPVGTLMKSTRAETWWDFSPRKSAAIKTSPSSCHHPPWMPVPQLLRHPPPSWFPGCPPLNRSWAPWAWHPWRPQHPRRRAGHAWEPRTAGRPVRPRRSRRTAQPWNTSGRLESCWQIRGGNWRILGKETTTRINYFQYSVQQMFMPNSNSNTLNTKICL